jgi:WD40 repeat protein
LLGFTPDEQGLLTYSSSDGKSRLWSLSGEEQASYEGYFRGFTPDGKALYTDSDYGTTTLWSLSGQLLAEFTGRMTTNFYEDFDRFSDNGQYLITSLDNTTHRIWRLDNGLDDLLARGCNLLESYFTANPDQREALGICPE